MSKTQPKHAIETPQTGKHFNKTSVFLIIAILIVAFITGYLLFYNFKTKPQTTEETTPTATATQTTTTTTQTNPVSDLYPDAPQVQPGISNITIDKDTAKTDDNSIRINNSTMTQTATTLQVNDPTDFINAATIQSNDTTYILYYFKDAAHSQMFNDIKNFNKGTNSGNTKTATFTINLSDNQDHPAIIVLNQNSSGWLIILDPKDNNKLNDIETSIISK